ncbi:hypothetical protein [Aureibaculum luteum]|uniref:hypothetical protein n=1 Tax=Aureibaculum luteum TaxID=1548456 RepID=UPI000E4F8239|nr:hypothetical protein [Aureibaculum luteum]
MKKIITILSLISILFSCKTIQVNQQSQKTTKTVVELGVIGKVNYKFKTDRLETTALPVYNQKIRVATNNVVFNTTTFKTYTKASNQQNQKINITYIDSAENKPSYVNLQFLDKVQLINELNAEYNDGISTYLQNAKNNIIITGISTYFNSEDLENLSQADEVYLINNKPKKYNLELIKNGRTIANIDMANGVSFTYTTASFCWKKEYGKISIVNITGANEGCGKDTYKNVSRLNKKVNLFKY